MQMNMVCASFSGVRCVVVCCVHAVQMRERHWLMLGCHSPHLTACSQPAKMVTFLDVGTALAPSFIFDSDK